MPWQNNGDTMADETYRKYHAGRYGMDNVSEDVEKGAVQLKAIRALREVLGVTKDGERGKLGGKRTEKELEE